MRRDVAAGADIVLHVGDIAYANGRSDVWDSFMDAIEPAASRVPYMVAVGEPPHSAQSLDLCTPNMLCGVPTACNTCGSTLARWAAP